MSATIQMDARSLVESLSNVTSNLTKQLGIVANKVGRKAESLTAKDITKQIAVKQKTVKKEITRRRVGKTAVEMELRKSSRIPLRDFTARQTKKGVSYRIAKAGKRQTVTGAFPGLRPGLMNTKWRGRVFARVGKARLPIRQLYGPSPWGVVVKGRRLKPITADVRAELTKQLKERIRYLKLKKSGAI